MKTITLDDDAYERLKSWKRTPRESFSAVVKNVIPARGTLGAFLSFVETHRTDAMPGNEILEMTVGTRLAASSKTY